MDQKEKESKSRLIEILLITSTLLISLSSGTNVRTRQMLVAFLILSIIYYTLVDLGLSKPGIRMSSWIASMIFTLLLVFQYAKIGDAGGFWELWLLISVIWLLIYASLGPKQDLEKLGNYYHKRAKDTDESLDQFKNKFTSEKNCPS